MFLPSPSSGLGIGGLLAGPLVSSLLSGLTKWVIAGTASFVSSLGGVLGATTAPDFGGGFTEVLSAVGKVGAVLSLPFLIAAVIQAIVRQDLGLLLRAAFVRLPVAFLLAGAGTEIVSLALGATDECCADLVRLGGGGTQHLVGHVVSLLAGTGPQAPYFSGFAGLFVALAAAAVALLLWLELAVRSAAVAVATLFLPLALAGLVWSATAHWARRLAETLAGLILAKLVIVGVLVLAGNTLSPQNGASGLVEGVALLLLAALSPFTLLRLLPMVESGAIGHLEGTGRRGARLALGAAQAGAAGLELAGAHSASSGGQVVHSVPWAEGGVRLDDPGILAEAR
ncbi:MAG: conjugal transfer protein TrbL, partial [Acidimicrobiaceae bacterium]|nr:conjugal transfer protein TrbL [Acidimicrobiaceae bacterium]